MKKWPDDELDKLFRKSAEESEPEYNPEDWKKMKSRLDANDGPINALSGQKWPLIIIMLLLLSGITTVYYFIKKGESIQVETNKATEKEWRSETKKDAPGSIGEQSASKKTEQHESTVGKSLKPDLKKDKNNPNVLLPGRAGIAKQKNSSVNDDKILPHHHLNASGVRIKPERWGTVGGDEVNFKNKAKTSPEGMAIPLNLSSKDLTLHHDNLTPDQAAIGDVNAKESPLTLPDIAELYTMNAYDSTIELPLPQIMAPILTEKAQEARIKRRKDGPGLAVNIGISPDLSTIGLQHFTRPGTAWKIMAQYRLNNSFSIEAGMVRSLKVYDAYPGDYSWPYSWKQSVLPTSVSADCRVLEIPLNLRYDVKKGERFDWFVTGGATAYKMLNEKYVYNYEAPDPSIRWYKWEGKTGWYWASHLNASVGVERKISRRISILAEPYLRIPIKKVGFGKVNLFTSGLWISMKYRIPSLR